MVTGKRVAQKAECGDGARPRAELARLVAPFGRITGEEGRLVEWRDRKRKGVRGPSLILRKCSF